MVHAAIVGVSDDDDRVIEVIEYPARPAGAPTDPSVLELGFTHVGLVCDDIDATRAGSRPRACASSPPASPTSRACAPRGSRDPWDNVFILLEKRARPDAPYYRQYRRAD